MSTTLLLPDAADPERDEATIEMPPEPHTLAGFRSWVLSDEVPEKLRVSYRRGWIIVDMSKEEMLTHSAVKADIAITLGQLIRSIDSGDLYQRCPRNHASEHRPTKLRLSDMVKCLSILIGITCLIALGASFGATPEFSPGPQIDSRLLRRPIALSLLDDGRRLLVGNRDSGTMSIVNLDTFTVESEARVGRRISDVVRSKTQDTIFATDEESGELIHLDRAGTTLRVLSRRLIGMSPVSVRLNEGGTLASVACLWPRRLVLVEVGTLQTNNAAAEETSIDLPFAPRHQIFVPGARKLIVADGFGGQLAIIDVASKSIQGIRDLGFHNIRGLTLDSSGKYLLLTHQFLNGTAPTQKTDIQNGNVLSNRIAKLSLARILGELAQDELDVQVYSIGDIERGAGDPADIAIDVNGRALVALAGVNEFAIGRIDAVIWTRLAVGQRPTAVAYDAARQRAYIANSFSDSIAIVDCKAGKWIADIHLSPKDIDYSAAQRGEVVFHDARRSHDAWMSCQSCHPDGHTNGRLNDNLSDGSFGTPKRVLSLLGVKDTGPWAWNGAVKGLEEQVRNSFQSTMQGPAPSERDVLDVAAYLRILSPPPGILKARAASNPTSVEHGEQLFSRLKCVNCHRPKTFTSMSALRSRTRRRCGGEVQSSVAPRRQSRRPLFSRQPCGISPRCRGAISPSDSRKAIRKRRCPLDRLFEEPLAGSHSRYRSISPMTMSMLPTIAGTSAIRQPLHRGLVTLRLEKLDERARTRRGTMDLAGLPTI